MNEVARSHRACDLVTTKEAAMLKFFGSSAIGATIGGFLAFAYVHSMNARGPERGDTAPDDARSSDVPYNTAGAKVPMVVDARPKQDTGKREPAQDGDQEGTTAVLDPARATEQLFEEHRARLDQFDKKAREPVWGDTHEPLLRDELQEIREQLDFDVVNVSCKHPDCVATVRWPDHGSARQHYAMLAHRGYHMNCETSIMLPEPTDPEAAYEASVILACTDRPKEN
jgi:hypothetical protein